MFCEKYEVEFQNSDLSVNYPKDILKKLDHFILNELTQGYEYLNPYKFAFDYDLSDEHSIKLFLFFTEKDKLFQIEPFVDCPNCTGVRLSLSTEELIDEEIVNCDECHKEYNINILKKHLYLYFKLNDSLLPLQSNLSNKGFDPHSTFEIFQRLNDNLKAESPSSSKDSKYIDAGETKSGVSFDEIAKNNIDSKGKPISFSTTEMTKRLMDIMMDEAI